MIIGRLEEVEKGQKSCAEVYRYGFNGKENDNEVKGDGNSIDFGARIYDSRLGRFLSLDPLGAKQPHYSPYLYAGNKPIFAIDEEGKVEVTYVTIIKDGKETTFKLVNEDKVETVIVSEPVRTGMGIMSQNVKKDFDVMYNHVINLDDPSKSSSTKKYIGVTENLLFSLSRDFVDFFLTPKGGGIAWYSKNGQGQGKWTTMGTSDVHYESIQQIADALNTATSAGGKTAIIHGAKTNLTRLIDILKGIKGMQDEKGLGDLLGDTFGITDTKDSKEPKKETGQDPNISLDYTDENGMGGTKVIPRKDSAAKANEIINKGGKIGLGESK